MEILKTVCSRCGKPEKIAKTWVEILETGGGNSKLTHTQISCTDKECQSLFEKKLAEEIERKETMKMKNEAYAAARRNGITPGSSPAKKITLR